MLCGNFIQSILLYKHKEYVTISSFSVEWQQRKKFWGWSATFSVARDRKGFSSSPHHWPELARASHFPWTVKMRELSKLATMTLTATRTAKKSSFDKRKTTLNVQQAFLYISLPSLHDHDVKFPHGTFYGSGKHKTTMFSSYFSTWIQSPRIQFLENSLTKDILSKSE